MTTIARYKDLRRELLQVELDLTQVRRAYFADGVNCPPDVRAALEERRARLRLELHDLRVQLEQQKEDAIKARKNQFLLALIARCEQQGRHDLVRAASADAAQWLKDQGMAEAYNAKL